MKNIILPTIVAASVLTSCGSGKTETKSEVMDVEKTESFVWQTEQFADIKILRYQIPGFEKLTPKQRIYAYYLTEAGLAGRDITWDQYYRHNLEIRKALEGIFTEYKGEKESEDWKAFEVYAKRVFFSSGIHHHYSQVKFTPAFSEEYLNTLLSTCNISLSGDAKEAIFNPAVDAKKVSKDPNKDLLLASAINFYDPDITADEAIAFYKEMGTSKLSLGLNSKVVRNEAGQLEEKVYKVGGLYSPAIEKVVMNLEKAKEYAENPAQAEALGILIEYYHTGDLQKWDEYNIAWLQATEGDVDYINSFIETYDDPISRKATYETIVQVRDLEASEQLATVGASAQWFEDNSTIMPEHKKANVKGVTYRIINAVGEAGATSPATPIGVNLPNANWIREAYGSKSISLGNIEHAYEKAGGKGILKEFAFSEEEIKRAEKYGDLGSRLHTALHEVVGHASGKINDGVGQPAETLKNYSSTLEEARADLVALYFIMDQKIIDLGLMEDFGPAYAEYENYIRNGMMLQMRRLEMGADIEEDHMRNRQLVASWAYEKGQDENVIEKVVREGKTFYVVRDYAKLRTLFGELLREIQRIKSEGDYEAGKALVEGYGVKVDPDLHKEVLARAEKLNIAPYSGFINPELVPVMKNGEIIDVEVTYPTDFIGQMLRYGKTYSHL